MFLKSLFKKKQVEEVAIKEEALTASSARNVVKLAKLQNTNNDLVKARSKDLDSIYALIKEQALKGKPETKILIIIEEFFLEVNRASSSVFVPAIFGYSADSLSAVQKLIKEDLSNLGYTIVVRGVNLPIKRIQGDSLSVPVGHELTITWG
jgi:hypothetical protein